MSITVKSNGSERSECNTGAPMFNINPTYMDANSDVKKMEEVQKQLQENLKKQMDEIDNYYYEKMIKELRLNNPMVFTEFEKNINLTNTIMENTNDPLKEKVQEVESLQMSIEIHERALKRLKGMKATETGAVKIRDKHDCGEIPMSNQNTNSLIDLTIKLFEKDIKQMKEQLRKKFK